MVPLPFGPKPETPKNTPSRNLADLETDSVTIVCCVRLKYIADSMTSTNPTQTLFDITRWSTIEGNTSVYCACMPMIRQVVMRLFPRDSGSDTMGMPRLKSYYARLFTSKRSRGGSVEDGDSSIEGSSVLKSEPKFGGTKRKPGFWTLQLNSASEVDDDDQQPIYMQGNAQTSGGRVEGRTDNGHIIHTTAYQVEYERSAQVPQRANAAMDQLHHHLHPMQQVARRDDSYHVHVSHGK